MSETESMQIAFVCVQNAGRSQMAYAFARRELAVRELEDEFTLVMGGTQPAECVHPNVVEAMGDIGINISDRQPREVTFDELQSSEYVITMGCSDADVCPAGWTGESRDWNLDDPNGRSLTEVAVIRDEIERRVKELYDELIREA